MESKRLRGLKKMVRIRKRAKQRQHTRRLKTKKGMKKVVINKGLIKRSRPEKAKEFKATIGKSERKLLSDMSDPHKFKKEYGGGIDFNLKGKVENINISPGTAYEVFLDPDYEVQYHTHPTMDVSPPTPEDVIALVNNPNQQAEIIFQKNKAFIILKSPKTSKLSKKELYKELRTRFNKAFRESLGKKSWEDKWMKELKDLGFRVKVDKNPDKALKVKVTPVEPVWR